MDKLWQRAASCMLKMNKKLQCHDGTRWNHGLIRNNRTSLTPLSTLAQRVSWIHWGLTKCLSVESKTKQKQPLNKTNKQTKPDKKQTQNLDIVRPPISFFVSNQKPTPNSCSHRWMFYSARTVCISCIRASNLNQRLLLSGPLAGSEWWKRSALKSPALSHTAAAFTSRTC